MQKHSKNNNSNKFEVLVFLHKLIFGNLNLEVKKKHNFTHRINYTNLQNLITAIIIATLFWNFFYKHIVLYSHADLGVISHLIWRNPLQDYSSESAGSGWNSGWEFHYSPLLSILSLLSFLWLFGSIKWLTFIFTLQVILIYFPVLKILEFYFLSSHSRMKNIYLNALAVIFSIGGAISGAILFPHYELFQIVFFVWCLYGILLLNKFIVYSSSFLFLSVREDSYLYAIGLLLVLIFFCKTRIKLLFIKLVGILSIVFILQMISRQIFFDTKSNLSSEYLGTPPLSHVDHFFLLNRIESMIKANYPIFIAFYLILFISIWQANKLVLRFSILLVAQLLIGLFAFSPAKGTFILYYALPFFFIYFLNTLFLLRDNILRFRRIFLTFMAIALLPSIIQNNFYILQTAIKKIPVGYSESTLNEVMDSATSESYLIDSQMYVYKPSIVLKSMLYYSGDPIDRCVVVPKHRVKTYQSQNANVYLVKFMNFEKFYAICPTSKRADS